MWGKFETAFILLCLGGMGFAFVVLLTEEVTITHYSGTITDIEKSSFGDYYFQINNSSFVLYCDGTASCGFYDIGDTIRYINLTKTTPPFKSVYTTYEIEVKS